jgi:formylglycine-generating enzyme required for sulfatase activity
LPRAIDDWFAKALSVDPDARFQSAREMVEAFSELERPHEDDVAPIVEARPSQPSAFATTVEAAPIVAGRTQSHAPIAEKHPRPSLKRRVAVVSAVAGLAVAAAIAVSALARTGAAGCPAGMRRIEGGVFRLGSAAEAETPSDETPQREVTLQPFCLDVTEVTVGEYSECTSCEPLERRVQGEGLTPNAIGFWSQFCNGRDAEDHPVNCVDWQRANAFCEAAGKRLPTEAEWELAARGDRASTYPWGEAPPSGQRLNACGAECSRMLSERLEKAGRGPWPRMYADEDSDEATAPVGRHGAGATPIGVLDLAGNVWEWTSSHYCRYDDPECGDSRRVIRGGGWDTVESQDVRAARRLPSAPSARSWSVGFRCARSL